MPTLSKQNIIKFPGSYLDVFVRQDLSGCGLVRRDSGWRDEDGEGERDGFGLRSDWSVLEVRVELSLEPRSRVSTMTG